MIWMHCQNNGMYRCTEAQQVPHPKKRNATLEDKEKSRCMLPNNATHVRLNHTVYTWLECSQYTYRMARRMCVTPQDKPHFFYFKFRSNMDYGFVYIPYGCGFRLEPRSRHMSLTRFPSVIARQGKQYHRNFSPASHRRRKFWLFKAIFRAW